MNRRNLLILGSTAIAWQRTLRAQQKAMPVIGFLSPAFPADPAAPFLAAFRQGLSETGYVEGDPPPVWWTPMLGFWT